MYVKIILKIHLQQKQENILHQIFHYLQYCHLKSVKNKHDAYRGKGCVKKFFEFLREHAMKIINSKKKKSGAFNERAAGII